MFSKIKNNCYDVVLGNPEYGNPLLYEKILERINDESIILDIGIGNGSYFTNKKVVELIKTKKITIEGIDIDETYIEKCSSRIKENELENNVSCENINLFTMNKTKKYDHIFFIQSFPLIPINLLENMLQKCNSLLKENGSIIFVHNLTENKNYIKPYLKYLTLVDFGKSTTKEEFINIVKLLNYNIVTFECIYNTVLPEHLKKIFSFYYNKINQNNHYIKKINHYSEKINEYVKKNETIENFKSKFINYINFVCNQFFIEIKTVNV
jgi:cyclopropane fatty-acyl-phospholipid synthase-like methyltransferase